jgi:hypothetical protein
METRANYLLIGAFTLAGFFGLLLFFLWFGRIQLDRQYAYYDVIFPTVEGLSNASEVRFSGLPVGQVVDVALDPDGSGQIRVRLEVAAGTPVRTSSVATIESLGVTGVSYVGITSGDAADPLLAVASDDPIPDITSGRSVLQTISEDAPQILNEILAVSQSVSELLGPVNQESVSQILANLEASSGDLQQALADFSSVTSRSPRRRARSRPSRAGSKPSRTRRPRRSRPRTPRSSRSPRSPPGPKRRSPGATPRWKAGAHARFGRSLHPRRTAPRRDEIEATLSASAARWMRWARRPPRC